MEASVSAESEVSQLPLRDNPPPRDARVAAERVEAVLEPWGCSLNIYFVWWITLLWYYSLWWIQNCVCASIQHSTNYSTDLFQEIWPFLHLYGKWNVFSRSYNVKSCRLFIHIKWKILI